MSSTNKTTNYNLSQFVGSDKPAWLSDYNQDMSRIDTQMKLNADTASGADGKADANTTSIGTLDNLTTDVKTSLVAAINEVDSHADTAQGTASSASTTANAASTKATGLETYLNLNTFTTPTLNATNATITGTSSVVECASNSTGSLGKIYGRINLTSNASSHSVSFATPLRPSEAITVNGLVTAFFSGDGETNWTPVNKSVTIATDGTATISETGSANGRRWRYIISACLIFAKSFGDVPIED